MAIKHPFTNSKTDSTDATITRPSNWNADHNAPPFVAFSIAPGAAIHRVGGCPAAVTEIFGTTENRQYAWLEHATEALIAVFLDVAASASAEHRFQYTTDLTGAGGWAYLDGAAGPAAALSATGLRKSTWVSIASAARAAAGVLLRVVEINGDGSTVYAVASIKLLVK